MKTRFGSIFNPVSFQGMHLNKGVKGEDQPWIPSKVVSSPAEVCNKINHELSNKRDKLTIV